PRQRAATTDGAHGAHHPTCRSPPHYRAQTTRPRVRQWIKRPALDQTPRRSVIHVEHLSRPTSPRPDSRLTTPPNYADHPQYERHEQVTAPKVRPHRIVCKQRRHCKAQHTHHEHPSEFKRQSDPGDPPPRPAALQKRDRRQNIDETA